ncbi:MAG: sulfite exporter TauE/SafE family protein [Candidatus Omnitrophica bacterium]|nr:sulfite exporter TauE/SafE family protein [Candidatus Omnitrophota bacterium]
MTPETYVLLGTALTIGFIHTLFGPDHYLPFIVMSKARSWSMTKTAVVTILCGIGHVASSIVLGFVGIALGVAVFHLENIESVRGEVAAWLFLAFGLAYFIWGIRHVVRRRGHHHRHVHFDGEIHDHPHTHLKEHSHVHSGPKGVNLTPWILFTIFVFGPCEPLIPILMYPAAKGNMFLVAAVSLVFGITTITTMLAIVLAVSYGLAKLPMGRLERYSHALAGLAIFLSGAAIKLFGL